MKINKGKDPHREVQLQWEDAGFTNGKRTAFYFITEHNRVKNTFGAREFKWQEDRIQLSDEEIDRLFEKVQKIRVERKQGAQQ